MKPYIAQIKSSLQLLGRDRSVLFFSVIFPLVFFFVFAQAFEAGKSPGAMAQVLSAVIIIGVLGNGFFGAGMRTVQDREANVLRRFKVAPTDASPIIVASLITGLVSFLLVIILLLGFSSLIYHAPLPRNVLSLFPFCFGRGAVFSFHGHDHSLGRELGPRRPDPNSASLLTNALPERGDLSYIRNARLGANRGAIPPRHLPLPRR